MAELQGSLFVTSHDADLTRSCLNKNFTITAQVYGSTGSPSLYGRPKSLCGLLCSTANQCLELMCLQQWLVVSMNTTNLIIRSPLEDLESAISETDGKNSQK